MTEISIIIVSYNVKQLLLQCVESIFRYDKDIPIEIIVVDNSSSDGTDKYIGEHLENKIVFIQNDKNIGFSKACNKGLAVAKGPYCLFLNPDTLFSESIFKEILAFLKTNTKIGLVGVRMVDEKGVFLPESKRGVPTPAASFYKMAGIDSSKRMLNNTYYANHIKEDEISPVEVLTGAFMIGKTSLFKSLQGFDEKFFMYGEDIDISYRSKLAGYQNYYYGKKTITHLKGKSTNKLSVKYVRNFHGAMRIFYNKHFRQSEPMVYSFFIISGIWLREMYGYSMVLLKTLMGKQ